MTKVTRVRTQMLQKIDVSFAKEMKEYVDWSVLSWSIELDEETIEEQTEKVNWNIISAHQRLSFSFVKKHIQHIDVPNLAINKTCYFSEEEWEELKKLKREQLYPS